MNKNIIAKVNDTEITKEMLVKAIQSLSTEYTEPVNAQKNHMINRLIDEVVLYDYAVENKWDVSEEIEKEMKEAKKNIVLRHAVDKLFSTIKITDEELKEYFEINRERFSNNDEIEASHILVESEEKCLEIKTEIKNGKDFSVAAQEYSLCPSNDNGGALGKFKKGTMVPEFEKAAFEAVVGEITEPVKTNYGFHLIHVSEKVDGIPFAFEEVREQIYEELMNKKQYELYCSTLDGLREKADIKIFE